MFPVHSRKIFRVRGCWSITLFSLCLCAQFQVRLPGFREFWCYPCRMVSAFHSSSCISSFTPRIFSFTLMGSGDTILCADHPILGQAVIVLHLDYPNCYESQDAFSSGHVERTSLPHRSDVSLGVMGRHPPTCKSSRYVQET